MLVSEGSSGASAGENRTSGFGDDGADGGADVIDLLLGHAGEDRQRDEAQPLGGGGREIAGAVVVSLAIEGVQVQRHPVHGASDSSLLEAIDELGAIDGETIETQAEMIDVPGRLPVGELGGSLDEFGVLREASIVESSDGSGALREHVGILGLGAADGGGDVGEV